MVGTFGATGISLLFVFVVGEQSPPSTKAENTQAGFEYYVCSGSSVQAL